VHTLPLPKVQADRNPNAQSNTGQTLDSTRASIPQEVRGSEVGTIGLEEGFHDLRPGACAARSETPAVPSQASASAVPISEPEPLAPSASPLIAKHPLQTGLTPQQLQFLMRVTPAALQSQRTYEIPACVTVAQAILESATPKFGWGSSVLFKLANNPFGIKYCHFGTSETKATPIGSSTARPSNPPESKGSGEPLNRPAAHVIPEDYGHFDATTWEIENGQKKVVVAQFQRFPNLDEAFLAHALLLRGPRYRPAFAVRDDWKKFAERLGPKTSPLDSEHCGYSTCPSYSAELIRLVEIYRLNDPRALEWYATGLDPGRAGTREPKFELGPAAEGKQAEDSQFPKPQPPPGRAPGVKS